MRVHRLLFPGILFLAALSFIAAASDLDCTQVEPGSYCTSLNSYETCTKDQKLPRLSRCPLGTTCRCNYAPDRTDPCLGPSETIPDGCVGDSLMNFTDARPLRRALGRRSLQQLNACVGITSSSPTAPGGKKVVTYYTNWASYRSGSCAFDASMVNGNLFTHMNFAFGALNSAFDAIPGETTDVTEQYPAFLGLRTKYPHLKLLMSFGGYSFNAPGSSTERIFSTMVQNSANRAKFISSAIAFCRKYKFDGVDIDWEYPTYADQGGVPADKPNFTLFLKEFRDAINAEVRAAGVDKLLLTIASPAEASILTGYELDKIHLSLDWINIMAYDMAGEWDGVTGFHTKMQGITDGVDYYLSFGIPPEKLVLGLATYGRSFTLKSSTNHGVGAAISGVGNALTCTGEAGFVAYYEIKQMIASGAVEVYDDAQKSAYCYLGNQWVGYDNPKSMLYKAQYINSKGLGGGMFWALDLDAPTGGYSELQCVVAQTLFASRTTTQPPPARSPPTSAAVRAPSTVQPPPTRSPPTPAVVLAPRTTNPPPAQTPNLPTPSVQWTKKGSGKFGRKG